MAKQKEQLLCELCGRPIETEYVVNMETFSGRAGWHMSFMPKIKMCHDCSDKLLEHLEKWFKTCNKTNIYRKF